MPDSQETCPICVSNVVVHKVDDEDVYVFPDHDGCGPFTTTRSEMLRLRMVGAEAARERASAMVRAHKVKGKEPPTI